ncbi:MAG: hypothetical protein V8Q84_08485 [Bilophila sp.]
MLARRAAGDRVIDLDRLTYSGDMGNLLSLKGDANHIFVRGDIGNAELVRHLLETYAPDAVLHSRRKAMWTAPSSIPGPCPHQRVGHLRAAP